MVWFVCKMRLWHMCTFVSENLMVKGLNNGRKLFLSQNYYYEAEC